MCAEVPEEVAAAGQLGHKVGLELHCELLNKVDHLIGSLARVHGIALANCIFRAQALIFRSLHGLDRNAYARVFVHAAPDRVAAALTNLLLDLVLVKRAREALRSMDRRDDLFTYLSTLRENRAALALREHELDRVPEDLLRRSWR